MSHRRNNAIYSNDESRRDRYFAFSITAIIHVGLLCLVILRSGLHGSGGRLKAGSAGDDLLVQYIEIPPLQASRKALLQPLHPQSNDHSQNGTESAAGRPENLPLSQTGISSGAESASQMAPAASPKASGAAAGDDLDAKYRAAIRGAVMAQWKSASKGSCSLTIRQEPGGAVLSAITQEPCDLNDASRRSLEAAALIVQPLPYAGFEPVFKSSIEITFDAD